MFNGDSWNSATMACLLNCIAKKRKRNQTRWNVARLGLGEQMQISWSRQENVAGWMTFRLTTTVVVGIYCPPPLYPLLSNCTVLGYICRTIMILSLFSILSIIGLYQSIRSTVSDDLSQKFLSNTWVCKYYFFLTLGGAAAHGTFLPLDATRSQTHCIWELPLLCTSWW